MRAKELHKILSKYFASSVEKSSKPRSKNPLLFANGTQLWAGLNWKGYGQHFTITMCVPLSGNFNVFSSYFVCEAQLRIKPFHL